MTKILQALLAVLLAARELWIRIRGGAGRSVRRARSAWLSE